MARNPLGAHQGGRTTRTGSHRDKLALRPERARVDRTIKLNTAIEQHTYFRYDMAVKEEATVELLRRPTRKTERRGELITRRAYEVANSPPV